MNREESYSTFSKFRLFLVIFLFITEIQAGKHEKECSSSCGDITNIRYPFRLQSDQEGCCDRDFELSCQSNKTILEIHSGMYYVKRISYNERIIRVVDVNLANRNCSLPNNYVWTDDAHFYTNKFYPFEQFSFNEQQYARFLNCSGNFNDSAYMRLPCPVGNQSDNVYVNYGGYYKELYDLPDSSYCSIVSVVPTHGMGVENSSYEAILQLLKLGFDLRWSVKCRSCIASGGYCSYDDEDCYKSVYDMLLAVLQFLAMLIAGVGLPVRFIMAVVLVVYLIHNCRTKWKTDDKMEKFLQNQQSWMLKRYSYVEIIAMTNHFRDKLGQGGFGSVYKGQLYTGCLIAVKLLENSKFSAEEFINEVSTIGSIHHVNVVQLAGFCFEGSKRALVYEYMPNGSLDRHIFSNGGKAQSSSWEKLYDIALGIARGIEYLHAGCDVCILHFDIKPHNILLDHNFAPKISDFGLAKFYPKENDFVSISVARGTIGYIAPELISRNFGAISSKSDVYSFGMLLLEMAGGRRNSDMNAFRSSKAYFPSWAYDQMFKGGDLELGNVSETEAIIARKMCIIGLWCIQVKAAERPPMVKVIEMLEGSIDNLQMPCKPFFSSARHTSIREFQSDSSNKLLESESTFEECSYNDSIV